MGAGGAHIGDDLLRLIFISCHPVLSPEARAALTLRLLGGLTTAEIARAFLVPEATIAQRIVRAKRTLAARRVPFELPARAEIPARLASVLEVIYLMFNEGYAPAPTPAWPPCPARADLPRRSSSTGSPHHLHAGDIAWKAGLRSYGVILRRFPRGEGGPGRWSAICCSPSRRRRST